MKKQKMITLNNTMSGGKVMTQIRVNGARVIAVVDCVPDDEIDNILSLMNLAFTFGEKEMLKKVKQQMADLK